MAAFTGTPVSAEPYASQHGANKANKKDAGLAVFAAPFSYTHAAGAGTGEVNLITLTPGKIRVFPQLSRIAISQMVATADFHLGHRAYYNSAGTLVPEDDDEFMANVDVGGGAIAETTWAAVTGATLTTDAEYDTRDGLTIYAMIDTANMEDGDTIDGVVFWGRV
jgi:hypothetical protein